MSIDPRLVERRRQVAEERARRKVGRLLKLLVALALVGSLVWLAFSPLLAVRQVVVTGVSVSSTHRVLAEQGVVAGAPMILVRPDLVEASLSEDPWVGEVEVSLDWPDQVVVRVEERVEAAWVETAQGWRSLAVDGVVLVSGSGPDPGLPRILLPEVGVEETTRSTLVLGSLLFVTTLDPQLRTEAVVWREGNGELWATVAGFPVRLGREVEMEAKARSLQALLAEQPPSGSTLNLIAPTHPAVIPPAESQPETQDVVEG